MGTPQLNIKDAEATRLARELAELTGESQTEAVRRALAERLEREKAEARATLPRPRNGSAVTSKRHSPKSKKFRKRFGVGDCRKHAD